RSCDGAIVALTSGHPEATVIAPAMAPALPPDLPEDAPVAAIPHAAARAWAGRTVTITGTLHYVFNNGKQVLLGFDYPHQGAFKVIIRRADWSRFGSAPERMYHVGQRMAVTGTISWYQGDPAIYVTAPEQIR
ncbi:MAG: pyrrolo-quinoline quinone, partial [Anaerolineae bacterium]|nr:pyrrolo-quinoline quinone [Anaerolineae bacterium]